MYRYPALIFLCFLSAQLYSQTTFPTIENWGKSGEIKKYDADILWDYINGAADYYLSYSFLELEVCEYSRSEDEYIKAEVYRHQNPINAFGIYSYERPPKAEYINIGSEAYKVHSALNFYCGNYYVKIHSHLNDEEALNTIKKIAESLAKSICEKGTSSTYLNLLPPANKVSHTEKYYPANYLGLSFLNNAIEASYSLEENKYKIFVIKEDNTDLAHGTLKKYLKFAKADTLIDNNRIYLINDMFNDRVTILIQDNLLYGIHGSKNDSIAPEVLNDILTMSKE